MLDDFVFDSRFSRIPEDFDDLPLRNLVSARGLSDCYADDLSIACSFAGLVGNSDVVNDACIQGNRIWEAGMSAISSYDSYVLSL
jgi:hypothetical protein